MLIDTHCHLHDRQFYSEMHAFEALLEAVKPYNQVEALICVGTSQQDSFAARYFAAQVKGENANRKHNHKVTLLRQLPEVYYTFGVHPENAKTMLEVKQIIKSCQEELEESYRFVQANEMSVNEIVVNNSGELTAKVVQLSKLAPMPVAIGEVGLDYHYDNYNREAQIKLFEGMLGLADKYQLPVVFHVREAFEDFFPIIANFPKLTGVVHSFSDNKKTLRRILTETPFYVGVNGMATYSTLPLPPLERIVLETDAPFLTPVPFRGIINTPGLVRCVAEWLSGKLDLSMATIERETTQNARRLFNL